MTDPRQQLIELMKSEDRDSLKLDALLSDEGRPLLIDLLGGASYWTSDHFLVEYLKERGVLVPAPARLDAGSYLDMTFDAGADLWLLRPPEPGDES